MRQFLKSLIAFWRLESKRHRLAQARDDAYDAYQRAIHAGDTRAQNYTWARLNQATNAELTALIHGHRRPSGWRGR